MARTKRKTNKDRKVCCNPFFKEKHSSWRRSSKLTKVTAQLRNKINKFSDVILSGSDEYICSSCRLQVNNFVLIPSSHYSEETEQFDELPEVLSAESVDTSDDCENKLNDILVLLGLDRLTSRDCRSKEIRQQKFVGAVTKLKNLFKVDSEFFFDDINTPLVKDQLEVYKTASKSNQFRLLTLFAGTWSRNRLIEQFGCSEYYFLKFTMNKT